MVIWHSDEYRNIMENASATVVYGVIALFLCEYKEQRLLTVNCVDGKTSHCNVYQQFALKICNRSTCTPWCLHVFLLRLKLAYAAYLTLNS